MYNLEDFDKVGTFCSANSMNSLSILVGPSILVADRGPMPEWVAFYSGNKIIKVYADKGEQRVLPTLETVNEQW